MKCFYHKADFDGKCAGAIVKHKYPTVELIGMDYGDPFPLVELVKGEQIFMVDFSLPGRQMADLNNFCQLYWIDHHATAINEVQSMDITARTGEFILNACKSGCELTWEYLFHDKPMPRAVTLLGRYDVWDHAAVPGIREFQQGLKLMDLDADSETWTDFLSDQDPAIIDLLIGDGKVILTYQQKSNVQFAKAAGHLVIWQGMVFIALNRLFANSLAFDGIYDPAQHDAMMAYGWDGMRWKISIYSDKSTFDAGMFCKRFGGGGHKGAAGFSALGTKLPFVEDLT